MVSLARAGPPVAALALVALGPAACGDADRGYCERARRAFAEIEAMGTDPDLRSDPRAGLARIKEAFAGLDEGAPEEVRADARTLTVHLAALPDGEALARPSPPEVQAAGDRLAAWLGRECPPES